MQAATSVDTGERLPQTAQERDTKEIGKREGCTPMAGGTHVVICVVSGCKRGHRPPGREGIGIKGRKGKDATSSVTPSFLGKREKNSLHRGRATIWPWTPGSQGRTPEDQDKIRDDREDAGLKNP